MIRREQLIELLADQLRDELAELVIETELVDPAYDIAERLVDMIIAPFCVLNLEIEDSGQFADDG